MLRCPLCLTSQTVQRHRARYSRIPTIEGVTFFRRICRSGYACAIVLRNGCYCTTTIAIEGDGVLLRCPLCLTSQTVQRHRARYSRIPTIEGVTFFRRICRSGYACAIVLRNGCYCTTTIAIERNRVLLRCPLCLTSQTVQRHRARYSRIPTIEGVTFFRRICRSGYACAIVLRNGCYCTTTIAIERNRVLLRCPLCYASFAVDRHRSRHFRKPTGEGITCTRWVSRRRYRRTIVLRDGSYCRTAIAIKGNGIGIDSPFSIECGSACYLIGSKVPCIGACVFLVPSNEGVSSLRRVCGLIHLAAIIFRLLAYRGTMSLHVEGDIILVHRAGEDRFDIRYITRYRGRHIVPLAERVSILCISGSWSSRNGGSTYRQHVVACRNGCTIRHGHGCLVHTTITSLNDTYCQRVVILYLRHVSCVSSRTANSRNSICCIGGRTIIPAMECIIPFLRILFTIIRRRKALTYQFFFSAEFVAVFIIPDDGIGRHELRVQRTIVLKNGCSFANLVTAFCFGVPSF